ncbi:MAG: GNAT family N-acetyltransferase [Candidatus Hodarchaeota archaeon]
MPPIKEENIILPPGFTITSLHEVAIDDILPLYHKIFSNTKDRFIISLSPLERKEFIHLFFDKSKMHSASCALFFKDQLVGYLPVHNSFQDSLEITAFGIDPQIRGIGLGQKLLLAYMKKFQVTGFKFVYTELDPLNSMAKSLYRKLGFILQEKKIGFLWKRF